MKSIFKWMNYSSILMGLNLVIYCKTVQFATANQMQFATVNLKNSNLLVEMSSSVCSANCIFPRAIMEEECVYIHFTYMYMFV